MENQLSERYFDSLKKLVGNYEYYENLLRGLYEREFYSPLRLDENRASWGMGLRKRFLSDEEAASLGPCRVMEMMIAFAQQINTHSELSNDDRIKRYFWMMVENLGMLGFTDFAWGANTNGEFNNRIDILLDRRYGEDGIGSLFPLQDYKIDPILLQFREKTTMSQRDIWSQCCLFDIRAWEKWKGIL